MIKLLSITPNNNVEHYICEIARTTRAEEFGKNNKYSENMLKDMFIHEHNTPFEYVHTFWEITTPIAVARQLIRHRMATYQEKSLRHNSTFTIGCPYEFENNKPLKEIYENTCKFIVGAYEQLVQAGASLEAARYVLPLGINTRIYWDINLWSLINFLTKRLTSHAQVDIRREAFQLVEQLNPYIPNIMKFLFESRKVSPEILEEYKKLKITDVNDIRNYDPQAIYRNIVD